MTFDRRELKEKIGWVKEGRMGGSVCGWRGMRQNAGEDLEGGFWGRGRKREMESGGGGGGGGGGGQEKGENKERATD